MNEKAYLLGFSGEDDGDWLARRTTLSIPLVMGNSTRREEVSAWKYGRLFVHREVYGWSEKKLWNVAAPDGRAIFMHVSQRRAVRYATMLDAALPAELTDKMSDWKYISDWPDCVLGTLITIAKEMHGKGVLSTSRLRELEARREKYLQANGNMGEE